MELELLIATHGRYSDGGRKVHVGIQFEGIAFCGSTGMFDSNIEGINEEYLKLPDPEEEMCKKCRKIVLKKIANEQV